MCLSLFHMPYVPSPLAQGRRASFCQSMCTLHHSKVMQRILFMPYVVPNMTYNHTHIFAHYTATAFYKQPTQLLQSKRNYINRHTICLQALPLSLCSFFFFLRVLTNTRCWLQRRTSHV